MKKILLLAVITVLLSSCKYVKTQEPYLNAEVAPGLKIPDGVDKPNSTSTLAVPPAKGGEVFAKGADIFPPDMPIRTRQAEKGILRIENDNGYPLLTADQKQAVVWSAMTGLKLENWTNKDTDQEACKVVLSYSDQDALERKEAGFLKKIFTKDKYYKDYSGDFLLTCTQSGKVVKVKFAQIDGSAAKSFLSDNVMTKLYSLLE
jgi:uncharacterized lipoprotein